MLCSACGQFTLLPATERRCSNRISPNPAPLYVRFSPPSLSDIHRPPQILFISVGHPRTHHRPRRSDSLSELSCFPPRRLHPHAIAQIRTALRSRYADPSSSVFDTDSATWTALNPDFTLVIERSPSMLTSTTSLPSTTSSLGLPSVSPNLVFSFKDHRRLPRIGNGWR